MYILKCLANSGENRLFKTIIIFFTQILS